MFSGKNLFKLNTFLDSGSRKGPPAHQQSSTDSSDASFVDTFNIQIDEESPDFEFDHPLTTSTTFLLSGNMDDFDCPTEDLCSDLSLSSLLDGASIKTPMPPLPMHVTTHDVGDGTAAALDQRRRYFANSKASLPNNTPKDDGETITQNSSSASLMSVVRSALKPASFRNNSKKQYIDGEPTKLDVLLGREGRTNNHPGNIKYREEVDKFKPTYQGIEGKTSKTGFAEMLREHVHDYGGRFLEHDKKAGRWFIADPKKARKKCGQALREEQRVAFKRERSDKKVATATRRKKRGKLQ